LFSLLFSFVSLLLRHYVSLDEQQVPDDVFAQLHWVKANKAEEEE
jgi:hypothetical protein